MPPKAYKDAEAFLADLSPDALCVAQGLRVLIRAAHPGLADLVRRWVGG